MLRFRSGDGSGAHDVVVVIIGKVWHVWPPLQLCLLKTIWTGGRSGDPGHITEALWHGWKKHPQALKGDTARVERETLRVNAGVRWRQLGPSLKR